MRRNSLILQKKFSTRWRHLYISKSQGIGVTRLALGGITAAAPRSSRSARIASLSESLVRQKSAEIEVRQKRGDTGAVVSGSRTNRTRAHRPARRSLSRRGTARWPDFVSPLSRRSRAGALGRWFHRRSRTRSPRRPIRPRRSDRTRQPWPIGESAERPSSSCRKPREGRARAPRHAQSREPLRRNAGCPLPSGPHPRLFPEQAVRSAPIDHHAVLDGPRSPPSGNLELVTLKQISMDLRTPYRF